jgi:hypothetical protein
MHGYIVGLVAYFAYFGYFLIGILLHFQVVQNLSQEKLHVMQILFAYNENKFAFFVVAYFVFHIFLLHYFSSIFVFKFVCIPRLMICFLCCRFTCLACYIILSMAVYIFCCFAYDCLHIPCIFCILHITLAQG